MHHKFARVRVCHIDDIIVLKQSKVVTNAPKLIDYCCDKLRNP